MYSKVTYGLPVKGIRRLTSDEIDDFLAEPRNCILGTTNEDGSSQLTPVGFLWDGAAFYVIADRTRFWVKRNLERDPRLTLAVDQGDDFRAVIAKGAAQIRGEAIWEITRQILVKYFGEETGTAYAGELEALDNPNQILVVLEPQQIQSWARDDRSPAEPQSS